MSKRKYNRVHCVVTVRKGVTHTRVFINGVEAVKIRSIETERMPVTFRVRGNSVVAEDMYKDMPREVTMTLSNCLVTTEVKRR